MLDFYLISDKMPNPDWPEKENLKYADGLTPEEFEQLVKLELIETDVGYWDDFRWNSKQVEAKHARINSKHLIESIENTVVNKFAKMIQSAVNDNLGLIAYCD